MCTVIGAASRFEQTILRTGDNRGIGRSFCATAFSLMMDGNMWELGDKIETDFKRSI